MRTNNGLSLGFKLFIGLCSVAALGAATGTAALGVKSWHALDQTPRIHPVDLKAEGKLLGAPADGIDPRVAALVEPGVMSVVFSDKKIAYEFYDEAVGNGEHVCLSDLGPQLPEHHDQRFWLRSC